MPAPGRLPQRRAFPRTPGRGLQFCLQRLAFATASFCEASMSLGRGRISSSHCERKSRKPYLPNATGGARRIFSVASQIVHDTPLSCDTYRTEPVRGGNNFRTPRS